MSHQPLFLMCLRTYWSKTTCQEGARGLAGEKMTHVPPPCLPGWWAVRQGWGCTAETDFQGRERVWRGDGISHEPGAQSSTLLHPGSPRQP